MAEQPSHGLTVHHLEMIRRILAPFADRIERVVLFGSRAQGTQKPWSDIDLVLYGDIDDRTADRIWTLFHESSLLFKVDVLVYHQIRTPALRAHIDCAGRTLFTRTSLGTGEQAMESTPAG